MGTPLTIVDSFTDRAFAGNPAGVCRLDAPADEAWMQAVAAEVNLAETAFVSPRADGDLDLRWFTPTTEVDLCGHATLASAQVLGGTCRFHTRSGVLTATPTDDGGIELDFPAILVAPVDVDPDAWGRALGLEAGQVVAVEASDNGWVLVEAADAATVRAAILDRDAVIALGGHAVLVADTTASADGDAAFDSVCRTFAPAAGIDEDPVTGSAHCVIAPWLVSRHGGTTFSGHQASTRGGIVGMRVDGDRVVLSGRAVTVIEAQLLVDPKT
jgi:predicted PhzF superfamily epimerase YddE/YHI9